jgi:hypothetical protein
MGRPKRAGRLDKLGAGEALMLFWRPLTTTGDQKGDCSAAIAMTEGHGDCFVDTRQLNYNSRGSEAAIVMIQVSCLYCGKKLTAKEEWVGRKGKCPACNHTFFIPRENAADEERRRKAEYWDTKSDEEIAQLLQGGWVAGTSDIEEKRLPDENRSDLIRKRKEDYWAHKSDEEITEILLESDEEAEATRPFFMPRYDDLTLFTLSVTLVLLLMMNAQLRGSVVRFFASGYQHIGFYVLLALLSLALLPSLTNVFLRRDKSNLEKAAMLLFAVAITAGTGIYAGMKMFESYAGWLLIFPIWNIITGGILALYLLTGIAGTKCITDETASITQIISSVIAITALLCLCNYIFELHWVYTYSIVVCYTTSLHNALGDFFGKKTDD